jgi:hypothetical protein
LLLSSLWKMWKHSSNQQCRTGRTYLEDFWSTVEFREIEFLYYVWR